MAGSFAVIFLNLQYLKTIVLHIKLFLAITMVVICMKFGTLIYNIPGEIPSRFNQFQFISLKNICIYFYLKLVIHWLSLLLM